MKKILNNKRAIGVGISIFLVLFVCYLIGQNIVLPARLAKEGLLTFDGKVPVYSFVQNKDAVQYPENVQRDDVPGGLSANYMVLDGNQKVFFMTPSSTITSNLTIDNSWKRMSMVCAFHPGIAEGISDGASVTVEIVDLEDNSVIYSEIVEIPSTNTAESMELDLNAYSGKNVEIVLTCDAGQNGDESGDWIIIKNWAID